MLQSKMSGMFYWDTVYSYLADMICINNRLSVIQQYYSVRRQCP